jgi:DNA-binding protein HU-beta
MNKNEFVSSVAAKAGLSKADAKKAIDAFCETVSEVLKANDKITLVGFGTFEQRTRNARTGCDPRTNAKIEIPASKVPAFKAGKAFKDAVNK